MIHILKGKVGRQVNLALQFDRQQARGMCLDIPAGTAIPFELGDEQLAQLMTSNL